MAKEGGYLHTRSDKWGKMPEVLMHDKTITDGAARLYTHMHWRYGNNCKNFEGQVSMAEAMGVSTQTIGDRIEELVQHDWIVTVERRSKYGRRPNFYHVFEVQADCIQWRRDHKQPKPAPKVDKKGAVKTRKTHTGKGGRPSHKDKPSDTYVQLYQSVHKLGASSNQNQCNQSQDNSELGVPNSSFAQPSQAQVDAGAVLNPAEREILRACADGVVIAHYHNTEAANHLIALGMIERCQCGAKDVLCSKGKCPTHDKPCPDDVKVNELQTALQQSFLPGSNGNQPETVVTPSPQTPLPPPAPAALPEVPEGYVAMYGFGGTNSEFRHYRPIGKKRTLCAAHHPYSKPVNNLNFVHQCPDCAAKAAARPATTKKAPREHDVLFKACATEIMGYAPENGMKYTKGQCSQINSVKGAIMRVMNLDKTPADYQRGADEIPKYKRTFKDKHPNLAYPTHASFETFFKAHWDAHQPKPEPDTSCPDCHGTLYKLIPDEHGAPVAHPCPTCQKEARP